MKKSAKRIWGTVKLGKLEKFLLGAGLALFIWWIYPYFLPPLVEEISPINVIDAGGGNTAPSNESCSQRTTCRVREVKQGNRFVRRLVCSTSRGACGAPRPN